LTVAYLPAGRQVFMSTSLISFQSESFISFVKEGFRFKISFYLIGSVSGPFYRAKVDGEDGPPTSDFIITGL
jgi:hypothetical protein